MPEIKKLPSKPKRRPGIQYQVFSLIFLPSETEEMMAALEEALGVTKAKAHLIADFADYETFMQAVECAQRHGDAVDVAGALRYILKEFMEYQRVKAEKEV